MTRNEGQCQHSDMYWSIHHQGFHDSNLHYLEIKGECRTCGKAAEFRGAPLGLSPQHPTTATDGSIRIPWFGAGEEPDGPMIGFVGRRW